jgi:hypothetical protein
MVRRHCPNDAMPIPQVAEVQGGVGPVRLFWCWSCQELFTLIGEPGRLAAGFAADGRGGWCVFRAPGSAADVQAAITAISQVQLSLPHTPPRAV